MLVINIYAILIWLVAVIIGSLGIVIYVGSKNLPSRLFVVLLVSDFLWTITVGASKSWVDEETANFLFRLSYLFGLVISFVFLYFCLAFSKNKLPNFRIASTLITILLVFVFLFFFTNLILSGAFFIGETARWGWYYGHLWFLFDIFFYTAFGTGLFILFKKYKKAQPSLEKKHLKFMFWSMAIAVIPASIFSIILPRLGYYEFDWLGPITGLGWVFLLSYSIAKYRQMDVKALAVEVFILVMTLVLFVNIFFGETLGLIGRGVIFLVFLLIGCSFIKSILKEAYLTEQLRDLNENLEQRVEQQTKEIKRAYEVEKSARVKLEELNKEKDRFLLATQHELRTPLTVIKGFIETALQEEKNQGVQDYLKRAEDASQKMTVVLNNVLEVTEEKIGRKKNSSI